MKCPGARLASYLLCSRNGLKFLILAPLLAKSWAFGHAPLHWVSEVLGVESGLPVCWTNILLTELYTSPAALQIVKTVYFCMKTQKKKIKVGRWLRGENAHHTNLTQGPEAR